MATGKLLLMNCARRAREARAAGLVPAGSRRDGQMPVNRVVNVRDGRMPVNRAVNVRLREKIPRAAVVRSLRKTNNLSLH